MTTSELVGTAERAVVEALRTSLRGGVIDRADSGYDEARRVWNGLIDRRPAVIARCEGTADVVEAVRVGRAHRPVLSIRGGGHQVAGSAVCDDGMVIDLSAMRGVHVDPVARTVCAQAGATWADVDRATQLFGLVTPGGEVSRTGIAGFTLGGGMGMLQRAHGLACDNLRSIEIVTADGVVRTASRQEHPDLFWAARGGGRGLGVVTSFEFDVHPLGPVVRKALVFYPYDQARTVAHGWRDLTAQLPDTVSPEFVLWSIPPEPAIPAELHGAPVVIVAGVYAGDPVDAGPVLAPLAELGTPLMQGDGDVHYVEMQQGLDAAFPAGGRYFQIPLRPRAHRRRDRHDDRVRRQAGHPAVADGDPHARRRGRPRRPRGERLPTPRGPLQPEHRRRLDRPRPGRHGDRLGPLVVGRAAPVRHRRGVRQLRRPGRGERP
jgi:FAD/FMN-containing dehydrogenase